MRATWDRARSLTTGLAAGALLILAVSTLSPYAYPEAVVEPKDALTLVRQALAALEVTPPAISVATGKIIKALLARDTHGVDMAHVQEATHALGQQDSAAAAAQLIEALRPALTGPGEADVPLLMPLRPRPAGTSTAYILLGGATSLLVTGWLIIRR